MLLRPLDYSDDDMCITITGLIFTVHPGTPTYHTKKTRTKGRLPKASPTLLDNSDSCLNDHFSRQDRRSVWISETLERSTAVRQLINPPPPALPGAACSGFCRRLQFTASPYPPRRPYAPAPPPTPPAISQNASKMASKIASIFSSIFGIDF